MEWVRIDWLLKALSARDKPKSPQRQESPLKVQQAFSSPQPSPVPQKVQVTIEAATSIRLHRGLRVPGTCIYGPPILTRGGTGGCQKGFNFSQPGGDWLPGHGQHAAASGVAGCHGFQAGGLIVLCNTLALGLQTKPYTPPMHHIR